jgi:hypothetical protein
VGARLERDIHIGVACKRARLFERNDLGVLAICVDMVSAAYYAIVLNDDRPDGRVGVCLTCALLSLCKRVGHEAADHY